MLYICEKPHWMTAAVGSLVTSILAFKPRQAITMPKHSPNCTSQQSTSMLNEITADVYVIKCCACSISILLILHNVHLSFKAALPYIMHGSAVTATFVLDSRKYKLTPSSLLVTVVRHQQQGSPFYSPFYSLPCVRTGDRREK